MYVCMYVCPLNSLHALFIQQVIEKDIFYRLRHVKTYFRMSELIRCLICHKQIGHTETGPRFEVSSEEKIKALQTLEAWAS